MIWCLNFKIFINNFKTFKLRGVYSQVFPSDTGTHRDPHPSGCPMQKFDLCLTQKQNLPMPSSLESLLQCFESMWRTHLIIQKAFGTCRSTAQSETSSSHTFTASLKAAPEGFLSCCCTAGSAQLSLTPGDSSALLSWWS